MPIEMRRVVGFLLLISVLTSCETRKEQSIAESITMYNDVLDDLLEDNYFMHCLDGPLDVLNKQFTSGNFDSIRFVKKIDSLKHKRTKEIPRCEITLEQSFKENPNRLINVDWLLQRSFYKEYFEEYSNEQLLDSVTEPSRISANDLNSSYVDIVNLDKDTQGIFGRGIGTISFSKALFNSDRSKAILYYEFVCGINCGDGGIIFVEKTQSKWLIVQKIALWDR